MLTILAIVVFSVAAAASLLVLTDSSMRGLAAWRSLRVQIAAIDANECEDLEVFDDELVRLRPAGGTVNRASALRRAVRGPLRDRRVAA